MAGYASCDNDALFYKEIYMKMKSTVAGLILATSMMAVAGASQATCATCTTQPGFYGTGWHMVPCSTCVQPALTWEQYVSGGYAAPVTGRNSLFFLWP